MRVPTEQNSRPAQRRVNRRALAAISAAAIGAALIVPPARAEQSAIGGAATSPTGTLPNSPAAAAAADALNPVQAPLAAPPTVPAPLPEPTTPTVPATPALAVPGPTGDPAAATSVPSATPLPGAPDSLQAPTASAATTAVTAGAPTGTAAGAPARGVYGPPDGRDAGRPTYAVLDAPPGVPPVLLRAAAIATTNFPSIRSAEAEVRAARGDLRSAKWQRFPNLTVEALATTRGSELTTDSGLTANLALEQPIATFGRIGGTIDRAEALLYVSRAAVDETARQVALQVVDSYYNIAGAARRQAILEDSLRQHRILLETIQNRVRQEVSAQADLDLAMSRTVQLEQDLALAKAQREASLSQFLELVGVRSFDLGTVPDYDPQSMHPTDVGAVDRAINCDPTVERLNAEVAAAEATVKVARGSLFPQVLGQVSHNEITGTRVGLVVRAQSGAGLSQVAATQAAQARVQSAEAQINTAQREVRQSLDLDFVTNKSARERVAAGKQASLTSDLVTESYKRQFIAGRRTWLDVMNSVREATSSKLSQADAEVGAMSSNAHIWLKTCGWQPRPLDGWNLEPKQ